MKVYFEWDAYKNQSNIDKHGISFEVAQRVFLDPQRLLAIDEAHSKDEPRMFCIGWVDGKILTVRFTRRGQAIRIIGAGEWREGRKRYEKENQSRR